MPTSPKTEPDDIELHRFYGMVTTSGAMLEFFELVRRVAATKSTVLVQGETGTGKELVARAIHAESARADRPFRAVNCAALTPELLASDELLASELFGHLRGAFTGAIRDRKGLFELADGGMLFLDEVSEISFDIQARLLRVLQERTFTPVGGTERKSVDVRIVSASNRALRDAVAERRFREDLMYRIRVVPIFLPPLIERTGDIEALFWHFVAEFNEDGPRRVTSVDHDAWQAIRDYHWPGNIRELRNLVEYTFAIGQGTTLSIDELPPELRGEEPPRSQPIDADTLERRRILRALEEADGKKQDAAEILALPCGGR